MTLEQLASDYLQLLAVTNSMASALQSIEVLELYPKDQDKRFWSRHNCWVYKGEAIANINEAQIQISLEKFKDLMHTIDSNQELKMLLQGLSINTINEPQKINETSD